MTGKSFLAVFIQLPVTLNLKIMTRALNLKWVVLTLILAMVFPSCQKDNPNTQELDNIVVSEKLSPGDCDIIVDLLAGQHTDVGEVIVTHDETNIYVTYMISEPGWCLKEHHLHISSTLAGIPQTKSGNPKVGHFAYAGTHDCVLEYTETIPIQWGAGVQVYVAAHAVVSHDNSNGDNTSYTKSGISTETAWGEGAPFPGNNWAMYFFYTLCDDNGGGIGTESEKAYAYAPPESGISSQCLITMGISDGWGWHLGQFSGNYSFELWALPTNYDCSFNRGFHVGTVEVSFKGGNKIDVVYTTFAGYSLQDAHLWISDEPWLTAPPYVVPEEFPYNAYDLNGAMVHSFRNIVHKGHLFMIAYASVYGVIHIG